VGNLAVKQRQLVAQDGDLDVLVVWFGTEADQSEDAPYKEEDDSRGHAGHLGRCPSWLLRAAILWLHPSGSIFVGNIFLTVLRISFQTTMCGSSVCTCRAFSITY
jgi:hypothetical protein